MLTPQELDQLRDDLSDELIDRVTVRRKTGSTLDEDPNSPTFGEEVNTYTTLVADPGEGEANALVVIETANARVHLDVGDQPVVTALYMVTVPVTHVDFQPGDEVQVVESHDARCQGRTLYVQDPRHGSLSISRRLVCLDKPTGG